MSNCCPTCGQTLPQTDLYIELAGNRLTRNGVMIRLTQREMECFIKLAQAWPWPLNKDKLAPNVGNRTTIYAKLSALRAKLASIDLGIENSYGGDYLLTGQWLNVEHTRKVVDTVSGWMPREWRN